MRDVEKGKKILILGDYMPSDTIRALQLLEEGASNYPPNILFTVKPHPSCPVNPKDFPRLELKVVTEPLGKILKDYDVAVTTLSSKRGLSERDDCRMRSPALWPLK